MVERQIVILNVAGSSPVDHPMAHRSAARSFRLRKAQPKAAKRFSSNLAKPNCEAFGCGSSVGQSDTRSCKVQKRLRVSERGEIGRHAGFRFPCRKAWGFKSLRSHRTCAGRQLAWTPSMLTTARTGRARVDGWHDAIYTGDRSHRTCAGRRLARCHLYRRPRAQKTTRGNSSVVEHLLAKEGVVGSSPISRSIQIRL